MKNIEEKKVGRKPFKPTARDREQVRQLVVAGISQDIICNVIGVSKPTLSKYFRKEIDMGNADACAKVAQSLYDMATNPEKPNVTAAIFFLKARAGWRDQDVAPGKKEVQKEQAKKAQSKYESLPPPPLKMVK